MSGYGDHLGAGSAQVGGAGLGGRSDWVTYRLTLVAIGAFVVQHSLLGGLRIHGAQPDLMELVVVLAALDGGPRRGAMVGFFVGLGVDLFVVTPFGLTSLAFTLLGFAVGLLSETLAGVEGRLLTVAVAAAASLGGTLLYALILVVVGKGSTQGLVWIVLTVVLVNAVLAVPAAAAVRWASASGSRRGLRNRRGLSAGVAGRPGAGVWR
ncbi:MAG: rod shape-determining protein MreD [Acidimicrobiales bacterium]